MERRETLETVLQSLSEHNVERCLFAAIEDENQLAIETILTFIKDNGLQMDFRDEIGRPAYAYAIEGRFVSVLALLLDANIPLGNALLRAVTISFDKAVVLICDYARKQSPGDRQSILDSRCDDGEYHSEMSPLKLAALRNNFVITEALLEAGAAPLNEVTLNEKSTATFSEIASQLDFYRAVSSEAYLSLAHIDPLDNAFKLSQRLREIGHNWEEFNVDFLRMAKRVERYAASLLNQIANSTELHKLFSQGNGKTTHPLPKIEMAIEYEQKEFVAHGYSQTAMSCFYYTTMASASRLKMFMITTLTAVAYPIIGIILLFYPATCLETLLKIPHIKMWMSFGSDMTLFLLVAANTITDSQGNRYPIIYFHLLILVHVVGMTWSHAQDIYSSGFRTFIKYRMNVLELIIILLSTAFLVCEWSGRLNHTLLDEWRWSWKLGFELDMTSPLKKLHEMEWSHPLVVSNALSGALLLLCILRAFNTVVTSYHSIYVIWKSTIGAVRDLVRFSIILGVVLGAVAVGMNFIYLAESRITMRQCADADGAPGCDGGDERFATISSSLRTLYWALFTIRGQNFFDDNTALSYIYYLLYAIYFILAVVILINLFIAVLSAKLTAVQRKSDIEWKFGRAELWMRFIKTEIALPPPFNLLPTSRSMLRFFKKCREHCGVALESEEAESDDHGAAQAVMRDLIHRYNENRKALSSSGALSREDLWQLKQDFNLLRYQLKQMVRHIERSTDALQDTVRVLNAGVQKLSDSDLTLDHIDDNRFQIENHDLHQLSDDVAKLKICVAQVMATGTKTNLISLMANMYTEGRTVADDEEVRDNLESYRKEFDNYTAKLIAHNSVEIFTKS